jgi:hypothetical protein
VICLKELGNDAVTEWYNEINDYDYSNPVYCHFSQVVWNSSSKLGIGIALGEKSVIIVANYSPAGNLDGQFEENVNKPS